MIKTLKRIADALEAQNVLRKTEQDCSVDNGLKELIREQRDVFKKYLPSMDLIYSYTDSNGTCITIPMLDDLCYFSGKLCIQTDKERVELLVINKIGKVEHTQSLEQYLPKDIEKHGKVYVYMDKSCLDECESND